MYFTDLVIPGSIELTDDDTTEPVTVVEVKQYLSITYSSADTLLGTLISAARKWVEDNTSTSLKKRTVKCTVQLAAMPDYPHSFELPYAPIIGDVTLVGSTDNCGVTPTFTNGPFKRIQGANGRFDVSYEAGYDPVPEGLKLAIMARVAATFENRGDQDKTNYAQVAKTHYLPFKRIVQWL